MHVKTIDESEVGELLSKHISRLHRLVSASDEPVYIGSRSASASLVQKYIMDGSSDSFKKIILDTCFRAEATGPGSGDLIIKNIGRILGRYLRMKRYAPSLSSQITREARDLTGASWTIESKRFNRSQMDALLLSTSPVIRTLVEETIETGSPVSTFKVQRSNETQSRVKRYDGYRFDVQSPLHEVTGRRAEWTRKNADIIVIDGIIESISEIHHVLERYSTSKQPLCIVCRNAAPEIITTLRHNFLRGTLDVVLCTFGYDELRSNLLVDAAVCAGVDVVSSLQGDLINTSMEKIGTVDKITLTDSFLSMVSSRNSESVNSHRKRIMQRIEGSDPAVVEVLQKRLACLVGDIVHIHVGTDLIDKESRAVEEIDALFRTLTAYIRTGYITRDEMASFLDEHPAVSSILGTGYRGSEWQLPEVLPASSFLAFVRYTIQLSVDLISIGLLVEKES